MKNARGVVSMPPHFSANAPPVHVTGISGVDASLGNEAETR